MNFIKALCPNCGEHIMLPSDTNSGYCMDCGFKLSVLESVQSLLVKQQELIEGYLYAATNAIADRDGVAALEFVDKILNISPSIPEAWICKMQATNCCSRIDDLKVEEVISYGWNAVKYASEDKKPEVIDIVYRIFLGRSIEILQNGTTLLSDVTEIKKKYNSEGTNACLTSDSLLRQRISAMITAAIKFKKEIPIQELSDNPDYQALLVEIVDCFLKLAEAETARAEIYKAKFENFGMEMRFSDYDEFAEGLLPNVGLEKSRIRNTTHANNISEPSTSKSSSSGGCYIATAVYGDYNDPSVMVLRRYRDEILANNLLGRMLINVYYLLSPPVANSLKDAKYMNAWVKAKLDRWVEKLQRRNY